MQRIKRFLKNRSVLKKPEYLRLNNICMKNYIWNKCILRKKEWKLVFKGKYIQKFSERLEEKVKITFHILKCNLTKKEPKYTKTFANLKTTNTPNEIALNEIMRRVGLEIFDEELPPVDTIYFVRVK